MARFVFIHPRSANSGREERQGAGGCRTAPEDGCDGGRGIEDFISGPPGRKLGCVAAGMTGGGAAMVAAGALGCACAVMSVFVVLRRWAFIGDGIAHAGFGGAGTAWLLALACGPGSFFASDAGTLLAATVFCLLVGAGIAKVTRHETVHVDTAIGVFLAASVAWGFLAYRLYVVSTGSEPPGWTGYVIGQMAGLSWGHALAAVCVSGAVVLATAFLRKEIVYYCFDPTMARVSGVPVGLVHYLLIVMLTAVIVVGMRLIGSLLITALLVLPGATALMVTRRMAATMATAVATGVAGCVAGLAVSGIWPQMPPGPAIVFALVAQFAGAYVFRTGGGGQYAR